MKRNQGFTLIEIIIYIGLFSLLLGTAFIASYQLIDGSSKLSTKNTTQEEGNFVMKKFNWALTSLNLANAPSISGSGCNQSISIPKSDTSISPVVLRMNTVSGVNYIEMQKNGGTFYPITTANVTVSCLKFNNIVGTPAGITATATIDGMDFIVTKYIRK